MASNRTPVTASINGSQPTSAQPDDLSVLIVQSEAASLPQRVVPPAPGSAAEAKLAAAMRPKRDLPPLPEDQSSTALQVSVGGLGMAAGFLYWTPADTCVKMATCGQFVGTLVGSEETGFWILFSSGFSGYAFSNAYFSSKSIPTLIKHLQKQPNIRGIVFSSAVIGVYTLSQIIPNYLLAAGTDSSFLSTAAMLAGAFPGALYTATEVVDKKIPKLLSQAGLRLLNRKAHFTKEEKRRKYYADAHEGFVRDMGKALRSIIADLNEYEEEKDEYGVFDPLNTLTHKQLPPAEEQSPLWLKILSYSTSIFLVDSFSTPILLNTYTASGENLWANPAFQTVITAVFSSSMIYNNLDICNRGFNDLFDTIRRALTGKPVNSAVFKLYPYKTTAAAILAILPSILSHSVVGILWEKYYNGVAKNELRYAAWSGIDTYHALALFQFFILILKLRSNHTVFELERKLEEWKQMTPEQFGEFVEGLTEGDRAQALLHTYENRTLVSNLDPRIAEEDLTPAQAQAQAAIAATQELEPPAVESQYSVIRFFRSLCGNRHGYEVVRQQDPADVPAGRAAAPTSGP